MVIVVNYKQFKRYLIAYIMAYTLAGQSLY